MCTIAAPAARAAIASLAICSGVIGTWGLSLGVSPAPVSAQEMMTGLLMAFLGWVGGKKGARSVDRLRHVFDDFLCIAENHHGLVHVEQVVVQARIPCGHGALVHDDRLCLVGLENGHAVD